MTLLDIKNLEVSFSARKGDLRILYGIDLTLQPGMPAEVYIVTGERTALDYITRPLREQIKRGMLEK